MKILHTADWHLGKLLEGRSRLEEQKIVMKQLVSIAEEQQADMVCVAGDIFDNGHPSAGAEALLYQTLKDLSNGGERLVVLIAGNHDQAFTAGGGDPSGKGTRDPDLWDAPLKDRIGAVWEISDRISG